MRRPKVLLLDTNVASLPLHSFLVENGYQVSVMGQNENDYLARSNNNFIKADYSDLQVLSNTIESFDFDFLVPGCNDLSYLMASLVCEKFGFFGIEDPEKTALINDKDKFRLLATEIGVKTPKLYATIEEIDFKATVIVKPVDAYSGRGISIVRDKIDIPRAVENAKQFSRTKSVILEEFVHGQLFSHSAFLTNGRITLDFIVEEHGTANPFVVDSSFVVEDFDIKILHLVRKEVEKFTSHLQLKDGLFHTQFIVNGNNIWLLEVTKRCPGDLYSLLIEYSTGIPYAELFVRPFLNQDNIYQSKESDKKSIIRHTISSPQDFFYKSLKMHLGIKVKELIPLALPGRILKASPFDRIGLLFVECADANEFADVWQATLNRSLYSFT
jgi:formate-dependent phosphoribosylglycinamide formyltransferase (GAR transformylase)